MCLCIIDVLFYNITKGKYIYIYIYSVYTYSVYFYILYIILINTCYLTNILCVCVFNIMYILYIIMVLH